MKIKSTISAFAAITVLSTISSQAALVAYWNFNALSIATASSPGSGGVPLSIASDSGTGTIGLANYNGTVDDFGGTTNNNLNLDVAGSSLSLIAGTGQVGNGSNITVTFSGTGLTDIVLKYATQSTGTGYNSNQWAYSTNGGTFTDFSTPLAPPTNFAITTIDFSSVTALNNAATVTLRYTLSGATNSAGNTRIDNLQVNAVPEPSTTLLGAIGALALLRRRR